MHVLVTGATGGLGREVVSQLLAAGARVRAMTRDPALAGLPAGVEVIRGDFVEPGTLEACCDAIDAVFLLWTAPPHAVSAALDQITRHARRVVFLSAPYKTPHPFFQQPNPSATLMADIEHRIAASGCAWTFLRPHVFASNAIRWWAPQARRGDVVRWPYLDVHTAPIDERDIAAVAARVLTESRHGGAEYVLTGPESLSQRDQIKALGRALGRSLRVEEIEPERAFDELVDILPTRPVMAMLMNAWSAAVGLPAYMTSSVEEITGVRPRSFFDWARDHVAEFELARH
jgi:uncharacterized protein YbjT (DUF2867 family)